MLSYYVHVPAGRYGSAGMRALQILAEQLQATIMPASPGDDTIVIYPEVTHGNPCYGRYVVRWILNTPGLLGGPKIFSYDDLLFTWDRRYYNLPDERVLQVDTIERDLFFKTAVPDRKYECFWVGKGRQLAKHPDWVKITRDWPVTRKGLAELLQRTRTLYSYDHNSMLLQEAALCGVRVVLLPEKIEPLLPTLPTEVEYQSMLATFVEVSQQHFGGLAMNGFRDNNPPHSWCFRPA